MCCALQLDTLSKPPQLSSTNCKQQYGMYRGNRRRGGTDVYMTLLLAQLLQRIAQLEYKPPLTLAVIAGELRLQGCSDCKAAGTVCCYATAVS